MHLNFTRQQRLLVSADYTGVMKKPLVKSIDHQTVFLAVKTKHVMGRIGLIVGKKTNKRAVVRNQIKRLVRESFRLKQHDLSHLDIVVLAKKGLKTIDKAEFNHNLDRQWGKLLGKLEKHS